jgi:hypothetical protein
MEETNNTIYSVLTIIDESGSMATLGNEPVSAINTFNKTQKEKGTYMGTLVSFNDKVKFIYKNLSSDDIPELTATDYIPNGMTALYDAIGDAIEFQKEIKTDNVIVVILTDGQENCSKKYRVPYIKDTITKMEKDHGWVFIYLGANQDSFTVGQSIGINKAYDYEYNKDGFSGIMRSVSECVSRCISHEIPANDIDLEPRAPVLNRDTFFEPLPRMPRSSGLQYTISDDSFVVCNDKKNT